MKLPDKPVPLWPDAGKIIGFGRSKIFQLAAAGELDTIRDGRQRLMTPKAIEAFVKRQATKSGTSKPAKTKPAAKAKKQTGKKPAPQPDRPTAASSVAFGQRGRRLWEAYCEKVSGEAGLVLLEEAARTADRLDKLDALLRGDADVWCRLVHDLRTQDYELRIDSALIEARQQGAALRGLIAALPLKEADGDGDADEDSWLDDL